ncbi:MAG: hypothetical protein OXE83_14200 [Gammaproteobacteria bacterium]|nr:hypothetical protein [Gammaproteobacteria bacterium]
MDCSIHRESWDLFHASLLMRFPALFVLALPMLCAAADHRQQAIDLGQRIDAARQQPLDANALDDWLARVDELAVSARAARLRREAAAQEDELQLERLYRSPIWSDIGFAQAAARYWRSWLLLDRHAASQNPADLEGARNGFQTTLALIVYPGLVRGSWFGLGHVALAAEERERARTWFERVAAVCASTHSSCCATRRSPSAADESCDSLAPQSGKPDDPLSAEARREIALLDALAAPLPSPPQGTLTPAEADRLEAEAIALLERHGRTLDGARRAAERLRQLEEAGAMNAARMERLLSYGEAIIGQDVGPLGLLVSAEDALNHQQFITAVAKYRAFFAALDAGRQSRLAAYRMRFVDALMGSGLVAEAITQLEAARYPADADHELRRSLLHLAHAIQYAATGERTQRKHLQAASQAAADPGARFTRALLGRETARVRSLWRSHADDPWMARLPVFELTYREFKTAERDGDAQGLAQAGLELRAALAPPDAKSPWALLALADMAGFAEPDVDAHLARLDRLARTLADGTGDYRDGLFALRMAFLRREAPDRLLGELRALAPPLTDRQRDTLVREIYGCGHTPGRGSAPWCGPATERLAAMLPPESQALLLIRVQQVQLALMEEDAYPAYQLASALLKAHPDSGDLVVAYAEAAARVGRTGDAEAAYGRVADSLPVGSDAWREARVAQLALRLGASGNEAACRLKPLAYGDTQLLGEIDRRLASKGVVCNDRAMAESHAAPESL